MQYKGEAGIWLYLCTSPVSSLISWLRFRIEGREDYHLHDLHWSWMRTGFSRQITLADIISYAYASAGDISMLLQLTVKLCIYSSYA
jgi:hypothetical protein